MQKQEATDGLGEEATPPEAGRDSKKPAEGSHPTSEATAGTAVAVPKPTI